MRQVIMQYAIVLVVFLAIDALWLSTAGRHLYVAEIGPLLKGRPNYLVAFLFYCVYALGLLVFVVQPQLSEQGYLRTLLYGGFFGLVAYATYDMTNLATLKGFTTRIAMIDMVWGTLLSAAVCCTAVWLIRYFRV